MLLVHHSGDGSAGLVLNRPTTKRVGHRSASGVPVPREASLGRRWLGGGAGGGRRARPAPARKRTRRCCAASSPMAVLALAGVRDECLASPASTSQPTTPTGCRSARSLRWWNKPEMERIYGLPWGLTKRWHDWADPRTAALRDAADAALQRVDPRRCWRERAERRRAAARRRKPSTQPSGSAAAAGLPLAAASAALDAVP